MMFLLAPLLIAAIIYYTAVDILKPRKKRRQEIRFYGDLHIYDGRDGLDIRSWPIGGPGGFIRANPPQRSTKG